MARSYAQVLRDQGRGVTGALLVLGISSLYTMETWWLGWTLPLYYLLPYAFGGLAVAFVVTRSVGFHEEEQRGGGSDPWRVAASFGELLLQSFVAAYVVLFAFGVVELNDAPITVVRLGLVQVVPLGFGAAIANELLASTDETQSEAEFPHNLAVFALGAVFVAFPFAPTDEVELLAARAGWFRLAALVVLSVATAHLVLHELEFRGHDDRIGDASLGIQLGTAAMVYFVGGTIAVVLLAAFGHFDGTTPTEWLQQIIVLSFPATIGGSAGEVVL